MVGWYHQLNGHEFEQTLGDNKGQGSLAYCNPMRLQSWTCLSHWTTIMYIYTDIHLYVCFYLKKKNKLSHYLMESFTLKFSSRKREMHPKMNRLAEAALSPFLSTYCTYIFFHTKSHWEETEDKLILQRFTYMIEWMNAGSYEPSNVMEI